MASMILLTSLTYPILLLQPVKAIDEYTMEMPDSPDLYMTAYIVPVAICAFGCLMYVPFLLRRRRYKLRMHM